MMRDDVERKRARRRCIEPQQLQLEAFGRRAPADARRIEAMQQRERGAQFVEIDFEFLGQVGLHFLERGREIAVFVERFDQEGDQRAVALIRLGHAQLRGQVIAQRGGRFVDLQRRQIVVVGTGIRAAVVFRDSIEIASRIAVARRGRCIRRHPAARRSRRARCCWWTMLTYRAVFIWSGGARRYWPTVHQRTVGRHAQRTRDPVVLVFEERILRDRHRDFLLQFERGQLQQPDGLLQLRGQRKMLR